ncbi:extracellular solute-binding protein [Kaistia dalseonensis]|uniref:Multiple sugar transport system substrate-binding protein n=1 Tax=Kaistia dalseonensis TaxID=410840 RepID=A0ABU0HAR9_9HYPH|nr:extracellular solute-binding protein [Kaistia dalseonensis]MCX5496739.1 extracellular solute-binding protein [Kaistia dalseonensis]MDQ0439365.1 multiple sugar transport system substrate-binding protein [Kaistia dalseonensis]
MRASIRVALLATVASCFIGSAFADDMITKDRVGPADAPKVLSFRLTGDGPGNTDPAVAEGYQKLFVDFIQKHPGWQIKLERMSDNIGQEQARMLEQTKSGSGPDCAAVDSFVLALFMNAGVLKPLNEYFSDDEIADLFPFVRSGITGKDGKIYAWWWDTDLRVLYRNKEIVADAPQTWDELKAAAIASKDKGMEGVLVNGGRWEGTTFDWLANFWAQGGSLVDDSGKPIFAEGENRAKFLKAVNYFKDLVDSGAAPKRIATIVNYDEFNAAAAAGTTALFIGGNWQLAQLKSTLEPEEFAKWTFSAIPGPTKDERSTGTGGWTIGAFSSDPEKVAMCAGIAKEIYSGAGNALQQQLPTSKALFGKYDVFKSDANKAFAAALVDGQARPGVPIYPEISNQIQVMMGDVLTGAKTPEQALDAANAAVQAAYARL